MNKPFRSFIVKNSYIGEGDNEVGKPWIVFILEQNNKLHYIATSGRNEQSSWIKILEEKCGAKRCNSVNEARKNINSNEKIVVEKMKDLNIEEKPKNGKKVHKEEEEEEEIDLFEKKKPEPNLDNGTTLTKLPKKPIEKKIISRKHVKYYFFCR